MNGKTAESRHAEHELMFEEFRKMQNWREEFTNSITQAIANHSDALHDNALKTVEKLSSLERGIAEKTSIDSGLMVRQSNIENAFSKLDEQNDRISRTTERLAFISEQQVKQIDDAHTAVRGVGKRVDTLERKSGKLALKILFGALVLICTIGGTWLIQRAIDAAARGGSP
jgi:chromosome segregation ATPase